MNDTTHTGMFRVTVTREYVLSAEDAQRAKLMAEEYSYLWDSTVVATTVEALPDDLETPMEIGK